LTYSNSIIRILIAVGLALTAVEACAQNAATQDQPPVQLSAMAQLGKVLFYDKSLSGSGQMSCATCHDPANHFAPDNDLPVQPGGPHMKGFGIRAVPSLTYRMFTPAFSVGPADDVNEVQEASPMAVAKGAGGTAVAIALAAAPPKGGKSAANKVAALIPQGGMFWDGRADTLQDQTLGPLMSSVEMANTSVAALSAAIGKNHGSQIGLLAGKGMLDDPASIVAEAGFAIARYEMEDPAFHRFNSKYDAYLAKKETLSAKEMRGLKIFEDRNKGNCSDCHTEKPGADGSPPLFTDFQFEALGAPRNKAIPANADPAFYDLGICGPAREDDFANQPQNCGLFKTPSLRNVASRKVFFHNGVFRSLEDVVRFYADRNTDPQLYYPKGADGKPVLFNDMPARYRANVDKTDPPFDRKFGQKPALDEQDISDLVAFLKTLADR
jgi:cytochrome c peroxidase